MTKSIMNKKIMGIPAILVLGGLAYYFMATPANPAASRSSYARYRAGESF